ncbi:MAG TPA: site-2 protease family protein [Candidatus Limnocylindria bacterium]|jgi:Zn-dependent protease/CBS domain-containing protein|nr:site-2 protease family protein [Candidatus Limnocylindria bacterium]
MGSGFRLGRVFGVEVGVHPSWLVIGFLVAYSLAIGQFPFQYPGWSDGQYWMVAVATTALFFVSVLAHELSHALVARRFGLQVTGITLFIFGGAANLSDEPARPRDEALMAAAGPIASLALGALLIAFDALITQPQLNALLGWLGFINLTLGLFNLIPGFPMDGGRILRAVLWKVRGDRFGATRNAALVGRVFGYLLIGLGVMLAFQTGSLFSGVWLALIGWFLSSAAESASAQMSVARALTGIRVGDVMDAEPPSVGPNETVAQLVHDHMLHGEHRSFLVRYEDGGLAGIVSLSDVRRVPREHWEAARVTDIMTRYADLATVGPEDQVEDAMQLLQAREVNQLPVVVEGRSVVGLLTRSGLLRLIDTRLKLGI